jgi:hypothetical protein
MASEFDVIERRKQVNVFKIGKLWVFKYFLENRAIYEALLGYYKKENYRFEFKSTGERNKALNLNSG